MYTFKAVHFLGVLDLGTSLVHTFVGVRHRLKCCGIFYLVCFAWWPMYVVHSTLKRTLCFIYNVQSDAFKFFLGIVRLSSPLILGKPKKALQWGRHDSKSKWLQFQPQNHHYIMQNKSIVNRWYVPKHCTADNPLKIEKCPTKLIPARVVPHYSPMLL